MPKRLNEQQKSEVVVGRGRAKSLTYSTVQLQQANKNKLRVKEFITPKQFKQYEEYGLSIGLKEMYCGPFVRSSYHAGEVMKKAQS